MNKMFRILELGWLVIAIIGALLCSYFIIFKDFQSAKYFLIFTLVSGILFSIRRKQRLKYEAVEQKGNHLQKKQTK